MVAPVSLRLGAFFLDIAAWLVPGIVLGGISYAFTGGAIDKAGEKMLAVMAFPFAILLVVVSILLVVKRAQTLGKHWLNIAVVNNDTGVKIGFWRYGLLREFVGKTLVIGALPLLQFVFYPLYFIVDHIFIFRKDHRTLHDMIANTRVVLLPEHKSRRKFIDLSGI